jgi:hypothetical protein
MVRAAILLTTSAVTLAGCATSERASYWLPPSFEGASIADMRAAYGAPASSQTLGGEAGRDVFLVAETVYVRTGSGSARRSSTDRNYDNPIQDGRQSQIIGSSGSGGSGAGLRSSDSYVCRITAEYDDQGRIAEISVEPAYCNRLRNPRRVHEVASTDAAESGV